MEKEELMGELKDILNRVHAYHALHKEGCFVFRFVGFKKVDDIKDECDCEECQECGDCDDIGVFDVDESKSIGGILGDIDTIRLMINELRDVAEDNKDDDGFVNI